MSTTEQQQPAAGPTLTGLILDALGAAERAGIAVGRYVYDHRTDEAELLAEKQEAQADETEAASRLWRAVFALGVGHAVSGQ